MTLFASREVNLIASFCPRLQARRGLAHLTIEQKSKGSNLFSMAMKIS